MFLAKLGDFWQNFCYCSHTNVSQLSYKVKLQLKICGSYGMLQVAERDFLPPAQVINILDLFQCELIGRQVGNDVFIDPFRYLEIDHVQTHMIFRAGACGGVKWNRFAYIAV